MSNFHKEEEVKCEEKGFEKEALKEGRKSKRPSSQL